MGRVALLGTGLLGTAFAEGMLARGGTELSVWNRTRARAEPLAGMGARIAADPAAAVRGAERVHLVLLDDDAVDATIEALRPGLAAGAVICDQTTTLPARTASRARRLAAEGISYLHCPVFMSPASAREAKGIMMAAGPAALFERVREAMAPMTGELWYVGERPDLASCYKLFGNAMILTMIAGLAEVFHMADASGVARADAFEVFAHFRPEHGMAVRGARIVREDYVATFTLEAARKDARLMLESGADGPLPVLRAIAARMDELIAAGDGGLDLAALARPVRR